MHPSTRAQTATTCKDRVGSDVRVCIHAAVMVYHGPAVHDHRFTQRCFGADDSAGHYGATAPNHCAWRNTSSRMNHRKQLHSEGLDRRAQVSTCGVLADRHDGNIDFSYELA